MKHFWSFAAIINLVGVILNAVDLRKDSGLRFAIDVFLLVLNSVVFLFCLDERHKIQMSIEYDIIAESDE